MRTDDAGRPFTVVFFTDGQPTVGETNPEKIVKKTLAKNTANTPHLHLRRRRRRQRRDARPARRGDAGRQHLRPPRRGHRDQGREPLRQDQPPGADRPEARGRRRRPAARDLSAASCRTCSTAAQLVVIGRYTGKGHAAVQADRQGRRGEEGVRLRGDLPRADASDTGKDFVEQLWARRKVGYLLDQIRVNGEKKELVDEVVLLAKRYGITTPYTSYLVVPDGPMPVVRPPAAG